MSEVLEMVGEQIRSLPKCFSRGVKVTYITGKGLHSSNGAKIRCARAGLRGRVRGRS